MPNNPTFTAPRTLLDAVNELLEAATLAPVSSLAQAQVHPNAADAFRALSTASRDIQLEKWHFNTDVEEPFLPNGDGEIIIPPNVVRFVLSSRSSNMDCVQRGTRLYNRREHTYTFTHEVYADVTRLFDFEECPEAIRMLIAETAGLGFVTRKAPGTQNFRYSSSTLENARVLAEGADRESTGKSLPDTSPHFRKMRQR